MDGWLTFRKTQGGPRALSGFQDEEGSRSEDDEGESEQEDAEMELDEDGMNLDIPEPDEPKAFYEKLDQTQELAETNYLKVVKEVYNEFLITTNLFWVDFASYVANGANGPFLSKVFLQFLPKFHILVIAWLFVVWFEIPGWSNWRNFS